jgi:hypothetical protein
MRLPHGLSLSAELFRLRLPHGLSLSAELFRLHLPHGLSRVAELFRLRPPHGLPGVNGFIIYDDSMDLSSSALDISSPDALS